MTTLGAKSVPKQFCALRGGLSMLRLALERAARFVPATHLRVVVAAAHRKWWEIELADLPPPSVVLQPRDRGTAAGVLLPVTKILRHDPGAVVVLLPADHSVEREWVLQTAIHQGVAAVRADPARVALLGVAPQDSDDPDLGWILPAGRDIPFGPAAVELFQEKPGGADAASLRARGALVNSSLLAARASTLRALCEEHLPQVAGPFRRWNGGWRALHQLYRRIPSHDLCEDVLEPAARRLWVVPVGPCGWTDLGNRESGRPCRDRPA
jgi:mannose-1-phosphate guanylyltransferase